MSSVLVDIPEDTLIALKLRREEAGSALRMLAAVKLFELSRLSSGAAARLAGVPRTVFLERLGQYRVESFDLTKEELGQEVRLD